MDITKYKILKYKSKQLSEPTNPIYQEKLDYYQSRQIKSTVLVKPHKSSAHNYTEPIITLDKISASGYGLLKRNADLVPVVFDRRQPYPSDIVVKILYCGVCRSDWHYIVGEWEAKLPLIPGHEITGQVIGIGSAVTKFKVGDPVAVGTIVNSCRQCKLCSGSHEQYCDYGASSTYNSTDRKPSDKKSATGEPTYGGFSTVITVNENYVFKLPPNLPLDKAAPLLCAGITTYSPLVQLAVGPGTRIGVAGIGGLGHIAIKLAKAMGAYVVGLTTTKWKLADCIKLGADKSVLVSDTKEMAAVAETLDMIIDTIPVDHNIDLYINLLAYNSTIWILGPFVQMKFDQGLLAEKNRTIRSSVVGGIAETAAMLQFCSDNNIVAEIETIPISEINATYDKICGSEVRYRYVIDMGL